RNALKNAITINNIESWNQYKNENVLKIIHWETWGSIKKLELEEGFRFIELLEKENLEFNKFIQFAAENALQQHARSKASLDQEKVKANSIKYQKEELAYMLTFSEFQVLLHPGFNQTQTFLYDNF